MSEFDLNTRKTNFSQNQTRNPSQSLKDQAADASAEMKQRAGDALRASTDVARDKFKEAADAAKDVAAGAADRFQDQASEKQRTGADFVGRLAGNIRDAARAFRERRTVCVAQHQFCGRICRRGRRQDPQRKHPRCHRRSDRFREAATGSLSRAIGASRFRCCPFPEGVRKSDIHLHIGSRRSVMNTKTDLQTISNLLGDALSQFAKLFQNEVDLARAELGRRFSKSVAPSVFSRPAPSS